MRRSLPFLAVLMLATACSDPGTAPGQPSASPEVSVPATLLADGSVPWADLELTDEEFFGRQPGPRSAAPGSKPCRAAQLSGHLAGWTRPDYGDETPRGMDAAIDDLIGEVDVRNDSDGECTLQGEAPTTLLAGGREVPMLYTHDTNDEARRRVIAVPAGSQVSLRLDWSGPFCQTIDGPRELAIELPNDGGTLHVPVTSEDQPTCVQGEVINPNARATLSSNVFAELIPVRAPSSSPLQQLTITVAGPTTATAGSKVTFHVTLHNPTSGPLALDPCPGYMMERFSPGDATNEAVNTHQLYRLNCRPIARIPARGKAVFEMVTEVPAAMRVGRPMPGS